MLLIAARFSGRRMFHGWAFSRATGRDWLRRYRIWEIPGMMGIHGIGGANRAPGSVIRCDEREFWRESQEFRMD
ncbi:hypothetical protein D3P04_18315 [Paracoccus onubensis]|uniref:Uncharacterized protein n=1 Tax=Paracoccus onubensis TaxID=1675788 RepID=A0A418SNX6_9RHOB|nr:hypothetical protein D3P04_18315 [Paracoccus onubensis]